MSPLSFGASSNRSFGIVKKKLNIYEENLKLYYDYGDSGTGFVGLANLIPNYSYRSTGNYSGLNAGLGSYIQFDALTDNLTGPSAASNIFGSGPATIMFWCYLSEFGYDLVGADSGGLLATDWQISTLRTGFPGNYNYNVVIERPSEALSNIISIANEVSHPSPLNTWIFYCLSLNPVADRMKLTVHVPLTPTTPDDFPYRSITSTITSYTGGGLGSTVPLKWAGNTPNTSIMRMSIVMGYDVELTDAQILYNFQSTRSRYGPYYTP